MVADGTMNRAQFQAAQKKLSPQIEGLERALERHAKADVAVFSATQASDALKNWGNLSLEQQRAVVKLVLDKVVIKKGRAGYNKLDLSRIEPIWKF
jgi:ketopantoate reductase